MILYTNRTLTYIIKIDIEIFDFRNEIPIKIKVNVYLEAQQ